MTSEEIQYFIAVFECKSISKAAARLGISSQGLGKALRKIEEELGAQFFSRTSRGLVPVPQAEHVYEAFCKMNELMGSVLSYSHQIESTGIRVVVRDSYVGDLISKAALQYGQESGRPIQVEQTTASFHDIKEAFLQGKYDYRTVTESRNSLPGLDSERIFSMEFEAVVSRWDELTSKKQLKTTDLDGRSVYVDKIDAPHVKELMSRCREEGVNATFREVSSSYIYHLLKTGADCVYCTLANVIDSPFQVPGVFEHILFEKPLSQAMLLQARNGAVDQQLLQALRKAIESNGIA